jgi:hypothetical protein
LSNLAEGKRSDLLRKMGKTAFVDGENKSSESWEILGGAVM